MLDFLNPHQTIARLQLKEGMRVADFGAGAGEWSLAAARLVGSTGRVYAIEVQKELVEKLLAKIGHEHVANVKALWGDLDELGGSLLDSASVDAVIMANVLFQSEHKDQFLAEAFRVLKAGGNVLVVDWQDSYGNLGPHRDHVVNKQAGEHLAIAAGFTVESSFTAGAHHYGLILKKTDAKQ